MAKYLVTVPFEVEAESEEAALEKVYLVVCQEADPDGFTRGVAYRGDMVTAQER